MQSTLHTNSGRADGSDKLNVIVDEAALRLYDDGEGSVPSIGQAWPDNNVMMRPRLRAHGEDTSFGSPQPGSCIISHLYDFLFPIFCYRTILSSFLSGVMINGWFWGDG